MKPKKILVLLSMFLVLLTCCSLTAFAATKKVSSVKLNKKNATLTEGETLKLSATIKPKTASKKVVWKSTNTKVATVSKGKVKALKAGKTTIICYSKKYPNKKATCKITVKKKAQKIVKVSKISIGKSKLKLQEGETAELTAKVKPAGATYPDVKWLSSKESVATVEDGKITAVSAGKATITCKSVKYPKIKAKCTVTVEAAPTDPEELDDAKRILSKTGKPLNMRRNGNNVSYQTDSSGATVFSLGYSANGVLSNIKVYSGYQMLAYTACNPWGSPAVTCSTDTSADLRDSVMNGSYNFKKDPSNLLVIWGSWSPDTSKADFQKMINGKVSDEVFKSVIDTDSNTYWFSASGGGSTVIIYGKNKKGELVGKFAGVVSYNMTSNALYFRVKGINKEYPEYYGENFYEEVYW